MKKIMRIGKMRVCNTRRNIFIKATIENERLSISGVIGPFSTGNAAGSCGQIDIEFAHRNAKDNDPRFDAPTTPSEIDFAPEWDTEKWFDLLDLWLEWHLKEVPQTIIENLKSMPETDIYPTWV